MVSFEKSPDGMVTVSFADKRGRFRLDRLPPDWETLLRDPDVAGCVNEVVLEQGGPPGAPPILEWEEVQLCIDKVSGIGH